MVASGPWWRRGPGPASVATSCSSATTPRDCSIATTHCAGWFLAGLLSAASEPVTLARSATQLDTRPTLLIAADSYEEHAANESLRSISPATIQLWEPVGASHTGALWAYPHEWERRVIGFLLNP